MRTLGPLAVAVGSLLILTSHGLPAPPAPSPDWKLNVSFFGVKKEPIRSSVLLAYQGKVFELTEGSDEVVVLDLANDCIRLLDLRRMVTTELTLKRLDDKIEKLYKAISRAVLKREQAGGRANEIAARMSRNLIDPQFQKTFDPGTAHLRLTNPSVEVDATGEPEPDEGRRKYLHDVLTSLIKLAAVRDPTAIPPFPRLEALRALSEDHPLRPVEVVILYRLAGPPQKYRWTYRIESSLTEREARALSRISALLDQARYVRFEHYETRE